MSRIRDRFDTAAGFEPGRRDQRFPCMTDREEQLREIAVAIIEEVGDDAHRRTKLRAAHYRVEGDRDRADFPTRRKRGGGSRSRPCRPSATCHSLKGYDASATRFGESA